MERMVGHLDLTGFLPLPMAAATRSDRENGALLLFWVMPRGSAMRLGRQQR
jgi:hypothetical protein